MDTTMIRVVCAVIAIALLGVIVLRRRSKASE